MSLDRRSVPVYNPGTMKLSQVAGDYIRHLAAYKGYALRTCECYDLTYRQFLAYLLGRGLTDPEETATARERVREALRNVGTSP